MAFRTAAPPSKGPPPPTEVISCGQPSAAWNAGWNQACGPVQQCTATDPATGQPHPVSAFATLTRINGTWVNPVVWCPADAAPTADLTAIRDQAFRLLPPVQIGSAWTTTALIHAQVILWADTSTHRDLGTVRVAGADVGIRLLNPAAHWTFGDQTSDAPTSLGTPYDPLHHPCHTAQCPGYYGHTYQTTGRRVITLTVTWHAQYRLGTTDWTDLPDPITGPTQQHPITIDQARGVLIPDQ